MGFIKKSYDTTPIVDTVFEIVARAKAAKEQYGSNKVIDATIGSLYNEDNQLVAMKSVFKSYNQLDDVIKAKYADGFVGNTAFRAGVSDWVLGNSGCTLHSSVIATPGGTGAVNLVIQTMLDTNQTLIVPNIAWGSYRVMANNSGLKVKAYQMFDGEAFNMNDFMAVCSSVMDEQKKVCVIINDPCHNPTGYSMSPEEWHAVISFLNEISKKGEVILLNDIAYIDYSYNLDDCRKYMSNFNDISENVLVVVAFSTSKTLTSYGLRCGAAVILSQSASIKQQVEDVFAKASRAIWSNTNNSAMENFVSVCVDNKAEFMNEKAQYIKLLKQRSDIFIQEAKQCGLPIYPYHEGFFITVMVKNSELLDKYHTALMDELIFTVKVNQGIRVAICSLSMDKCEGLAKKMNNILNRVLGK